MNSKQTRSENKAWISNEWMNGWINHGYFRLYIICHSRQKTLNELNEMSKYCANPAPGFRYHCSPSPILPLHYYLLIKMKFKKKAQQQNQDPTHLSGFFTYFLIFFLHFTHRHMYAWVSKYDFSCNCLTSYLSWYVAFVGFVVVNILLFPSSLYSYISFVLK